MTSENSADRVRAFIAIPLPQDLKKSLAALQRQLLSDNPGLKPVAPDNLHLTLRFLGDRRQDELADIGRIMLSVAARKRFFNVLLEGLGVFPNLRRPRVLWVGLNPPDEIIALAGLLNDNLALLGLPPEQQPFRPHLTLGRFKNQKQRAVSLCPFLTQCYGSLKIDRMVVYRSNLTRAGAIHTPLVTAELAAVEG